MLEIGRFTGMQTLVPGQPEAQVGTATVTRRLDARR
jgi:hypothetical protein